MFDVEVPEGGLPFICSVPGHAAAGMTGTISVAGSTAGGGDSHGGPAPDTGAVEADPNAPAYTLDDATAPKVMDGTVHEITLTIEEKEMTVAEGFVQKVWTFNGSVPGPVIRVHQGDTIRVHLVNPAASEVDHSIDFHASQVAWNDEMRSIKPGDEMIYEWKADYAGVWMYHCGTAPALHHIANGMYGMVIVEPKGGFKPATTSSRSSRASGTSVHRARSPTSPRLRPARRPPTSWSSTAWPTSTSTTPSRSRPARRCGSSSSMPARASTARSMSWARSSTRSSRKASS